MPKKRNSYWKQNKKAYRPTPPFIAVEGIESFLWDMLSPLSVWVLVEFYRKADAYNRGNLSLTYKEVKPKMSNLIFLRSIWQLIGLGFLDVRRFGKLQRNCSIYILSHRWRSIEEDQKRAEKIQSLLDEVERLKKLPGSYKKRIKIAALRNKILEIGGHVNPGKYINRASQRDAVNKNILSPGDAEMGGLC